MPSVPVSPGAYNKRRKAALEAVSRIEPETKKAIRKMYNDDKILRSMPITEKQLGQIKKHYGIK